MKKTLLILTAVTMAVASSQAQGFVTFGSSTQNVSTNNTLAVLGATATGKTLGAGSFYYALFYSTSLTTINGSGAAVAGIGATNLFGSGFTFSGDYASSTSTAGRWTSLNPNGDGTSTVSGLAGGASAQFVILGWSSTLGTTISALQTSLSTPGTAGFIGQSVISGSLQAGDGALVTPATISSSGAPGIQGFTLGSFAIAPTPEPATLALAGLSGASLLLFRRRK